MAEPRTRSTRSIIPKQAVPIKRRQVVQSYLTVDVIHGDPEDLYRIRIELLYGANYNDPGYFDEIAALQRSCCLECGLADMGFFFHP